MRCRVAPLRAIAAGVLLLPVFAPRAAAGQTTAATPTVRGERSFAGFPPGRCVIAGKVMEESLRRGVPDTARYAPAEDTLAHSTTDSLTQCSAAASAAAPRGREVLDAARLHLLTGSDSLSDSLVAARLRATRQSPAQARAWELQLIVRDRLSGKPARRASAYEALHSLDALGAAAAGERLTAHAAMASDEARLQNDSAVRVQSAAVIQAWKALPQSSRSWYAGQLADAIRTRADVELFADRATDARAALAEGLSLIPADAQRARQSLQRAVKMYDLVGKAAAPARAHFWFGEPGTANAASGALDASRPGKGKVAVLLTLGRPCTAWCSALLAAAHRLRERFGSDESLELTFLTNTMGFYLDSAPATPEAEARYDSSYFVGERHVPGMIGVVETRYTWQSDGRRLDAPTANEVSYADAFVVIVDKRGVVRYIGGPWNRGKEPRYVRVLERLLKES